MTVSIDMNVRMESVGPVHYNGHWISYGFMFDEWKMRCTTCEQERSGSTERFHELDEAHEPYFWLHQIQKYDEPCDNPKDDWTDAVIEKMQMEYNGRIADDATRHEMQRTIENDILVGPVDAEVKF